MSAPTRKTSDLSPRSAERLRKAHALGATKFILRRGILGWGVPMFVIFTMLPAFRAVPWFPWVATNLAVSIPLGAVVWLGGGYVFGRWMWKMVSRQYAELENKD